MIIGGNKLGFIHDRYVSAKISINELWGTIAQAFDYTSTDAPFARPVAGFWAKP
jgi:hypothetical protein